MKNAQSKPVEAGLYGLLIAWAVNACPAVADEVADAKAAVGQACPTIWEDITTEIQVSQVVGDIWEDDIEGFNAFIDYMETTMGADAPDESGLTLMASDKLTVAAECATRRTALMQLLIEKLPNDILIAMESVGGQLEVAASNVPVVEDVTFGSSGGDRYNIYYPTGIQAGDFLLLLSGGDGNSGTSGGVSGFSKLAQVGGDERHHVYFRIATGSESGWVSVDTNNGGNSSGMMARISGVNTSDPFVRRGGFDSKALNGVVTASMGPSDITDADVRNTLYFLWVSTNSSRRYSSRFPAEATYLGSRSHDSHTGFWMSYLHDGIGDPGRLSITINNDDSVRASVIGIQPE